MRRILVLILGIVMTVAMASSALAQSGHFVTGGRNAPTCRDAGTTVVCEGKVAGLGGTTFRIEVDAEGLAIVQCRNPGGNVAPGQNTTVNVEGNTGDLATPRNGQFQFRVATLDPEPLPPTPTCPNAQWTPELTDVIFTEATLSLFENGTLSDQITVQVQ